MVSSFLGQISESVQRLARFIRRRSDERGFTVFTTGSVPAGGTLNLHLANPTTDTTADIHAVDVNTQFRGRFTIHDTFSSDPSGGTDATIDNMRMSTSNGSPDSGTMEAATGVTFDSTNEHYAAVLPSGGSGGTMRGGHAEATQPLLDPGRQIVIEVTNESDTARPASIEITYTEAPEIRT